VAGHAYLNKLAAQVRLQAIETLKDLIADDEGGRELEALEAARRDAVASKDPQFEIVALCGALARIVEAQQAEIEKLKRTKANAASLSQKGS
jgi:hypothetical protein